MPKVVTVPSLVRKPIAMSGTTVFMVTVLRNDNSFDDHWCWEYEDTRDFQREAARELIEQIGDEASINFLWELRDAIATQIDEHNKRFGTDFAQDRPH